MNGGNTVASIGDHASVQPPTGEVTWQRLLAEAVRDVDVLWEVLDLPREALPAARESAKLFPLVAPRGFIARMRRGDLNDPLLRQIAPLAEEQEQQSGFGPDPVGEFDCSPVPGLLHKYHGRALLIATAACAVHCRYCFRRHYPYQDVSRSGRWWKPAMDWLADQPAIDEILLSGGDPLTLPDRVLAGIMEDADQLPQMRRIRIHTRLPVVLPERIDAGLCQVIASRRCQVVVVSHATHAHEIDDTVRAACQRLRAAGALLLNQSVLLRGINDDAAILAALSVRLCEAGVLPYYLHVLDRVAGASHFLRTDDDALTIHKALSDQLPGYLVPRLVREEAGAAGKTPLTRDKALTKSASPANGEL